MAWFLALSLHVCLPCKGNSRHKSSQEASRFWMSPGSIRLAVERADIADRLAKLFGANHAAHNFAGARLGQAGRELQLFWNGQSADGCAYVQLQLFFQVCGRLVALFDDDKDLDMFTLQWIGLANGGCLCHCRMAHQAGLDLHRSQAVSA